MHYNTLAVDWWGLGDTYMVDSDLIGRNQSPRDGMTGLCNSIPPGGLMEDLSP